MSELKRQLPMREFYGWLVYFKLRQEAEAKAVDDARRGK